MKVGDAEEYLKVNFLMLLYFRGVEANARKLVLHWIEVLKILVKVHGRQSV